MKIRNHRAVATATVAVAALCGLAATGVAAQASDGSDHVVSVDFRPGQSAGDGCATRGAGLSMSTNETADTYSYVFTVKTDLCDPIDAWAAVYQMPASAWPWPQTFVEKAPIPLGAAGVTTVTFSKECTPLQFDIIEGSNTPPVIDLLGDHHSPLLYPNNGLDFSGSSAHQFFPTNPDCFPTSSTTTPTVAPTSSSTTPTSEPPVTVSPETTIKENSDGPGPSVSPNVGSQPGATVEGVQVTQSPAALSVSG